VIGTTIGGKYLVKRQLGAGAMGSVYEAEHTSTGRRTALKVISAGDLTRDQAMLARFEREARAAGAIDTQHITQVLDAGLDEATQLPFLVMEYMAGEDVQHAIKRVGPLPPDLAMRITAQACLGLQKAHDAGVVHRDMKPANLFLAQRDAGEIIVKILDFGIAKVKMDASQEVESAGLTKTGSMLGSPLYMSPEQAKGSREIDHRTDIWSLGVVFYQALCGRTPYQHATALGELIISICSEWPPLVQEFAPWVPTEVAAIVHRCLRHNPAERYQSAMEMFQALKQLLPGGWSIREEMVVPIGDAMKGSAAPKLALTTSLSAAQTAAGGPPAEAVGTTGAGTAVTMAGATNPAVTQRPASKAPLFAALGVLAIAGLGGAYVMTRPQPPPVIAQATAQPAITAAPTAAETAAATTTAAAPAPAGTLRVKVVIMPADAQAEVEGEKSPVKGGLLEITGALGSVHRVHVFKGKMTTTTDVVVTNVGANPPKIELTPAGQKPAASASGSSGPAAPAPASSDISTTWQ